MATGYTIPDGRDLSDLFGVGDYGSVVGYQTANGKDLGRQFAGGSTGIVTRYTDRAGVDLGSRFGPPGHCVLTCAQRGDACGFAYGAYGDLSPYPIFGGTGIEALIYNMKDGCTQLIAEMATGSSFFFSLVVNGVTFPKIGGYDTTWFFRVSGNPLGLQAGARIPLIFDPAPTGYE